MTPGLALSRRVVLGPLLLLVLGLVGASCSGGSPEAGAATSVVSAGSDTAAAATSTVGPDSASGATTTLDIHAQGLRFAQCMRDNGVKEFPDPSPSGELTIDAVANGSSLDTDTAAFKRAITACKDLEPPGFTGHKRTAAQQEAALQFAQCMRDNGVRDFPDPSPAGPLIDTTQIPSLGDRSPLTDPVFQAAQKKCGALYAGQIGIRVP